MAKKVTDDNIEGYEEKDKPINKIVTALIAFIVVFIILSVFALLIKLDIGEVGSKFLRPILKDVPIVNKILPTVPESKIAEENNYPYESLKEAIDQIKKLEKEIEGTKESKEKNESSILDLQAEIARLKVFEDNQLEYEQRVLDFETNVVFAEEAPDLEEYQAYYESINPTNAEELYRQVVEQIAISNKIKKFSDTFSSMKPESAAAIFETMTADLDLVSDILMNMKPAQRGEILAAMDSTAAAKITKKMSPKDE